MYDLTATPSEAGRRDLRRVLAISVVGHIVLLLGLVISPPGARNTTALPGVLRVSLLAAPQGAPSASKPRVSRRPAPPPPPAPTLKKKVLPKTPRAQAKTTPKAEPKAVAPPKEESLNDVLKNLRDEAGESRPQAQASAAAESGGEGPGILVSPEVHAWLRRAEIHVKQAWILAPGFRFESLQAHAEVQLDASGRILGSPRILQRSGNPWFDESVIRAIQKADPLPAPPEAGRWSFVFSPADLR